MMSFIKLLALCKKCTISRYASCAKQALRRCHITCCTCALYRIFLHTRQRFCCVKKCMNALHARGKTYGAMVALWAIMFGYSMSVTAQNHWVDGIAATVNNDIVLQSELDARVQTVFNNLRSTGQPVPPLSVLRESLLEQLILENIQLQMASRSGMRVSDAELNEAMEQVAAQNSMDLLQFKVALEAQGLSYADVREQIRRELLLRGLQQNMVNPRVHITNQAIDNFFLSQEGKALVSLDYRVLHALIPTASDATQAAVALAQEQAETLYQAIETGQSFAAVMDRANISVTDLGWRSVQELPSLLVPVVPQLRVGQTAPPLRSASGFHLIALADRRGDSETIEQTKARHILLKVSVIRDDAATADEVDDLRQQAIEGDDFLALARQYSEDIGSALEGGDLGWVSPGQMVPAFQEAMDDTPIGQISPAVRSSLGWHIILVEDRRQQDVTDAWRRHLARNILHQRQYEDELEAWLQEIRAQAYIEIKNQTGD